MNEKQKTRKKLIIPIPVVVAIIGLIGTVIVAIPSFLNIENSLFIWNNNSQVSYVRYDDPSGTFSIEYPSENGIYNREITEDNYLSVEILPRNRVFVFDKGFYITDRDALSLDIICGTSPNILSNDQLIALSENVLLELGYKDLILITTNKTEDGYYVQYESKFASKKKYSSVLYKYKEGAFIVVHISGNEVFESTKSISEHIISSLVWYPSGIVEFFKD